MCRLNAQSDKVLRVFFVSRDFIPGYYCSTRELGLSQKVLSDKNNIPSSGSYAGAGGHGTVVFAVVTTVPCSDSKVSKNLKSLSERWNVVTTRYFETASSLSTDPTIVIFGVNVYEPELRRRGGRLTPYAYFTFRISDFVFQNVFHIPTYAEGVTSAKPHSAAADA